MPPSWNITQTFQDHGCLLAQVQQYTILSRSSRGSTSIGIGTSQTAAHLGMIFYCYIVCEQEFRFSIFLIHYFNFNIIIFTQYVTSRVIYSYWSWFPLYVPLCTVPSQVWVCPTSNWSYLSRFSSQLCILWRMLICINIWISSSFG